jgi:hypothetical protein
MERETLAGDTKNFIEYSYCPDGSRWQRQVSNTINAALANSVKSEQGPRPGKGRPLGASSAGLQGHETGRAASS